MIVRSVHDPAIYDKGLFDKDGNYEALVSRHLDSMAFSHLSFFDEGEDGASTMAKELQQAAQQTPSLALKLTAVINSQRVVRIRTSSKRPARMMPELDRPGSAQAALLGQHKEIDVTVVAPRTLEAMRRAGIGIERACPINRYHECAAYRQEVQACGGVPLGAFTEDRLLQEVIRPIVYWAEQCTIIDKVISGAAFGGESGKKSGNWQLYKDTIRAVFDIWRDRYFKHGNGGFRVISNHVGRHVGDKEAMELAKELDLLDQPGVEICLKPDRETRCLIHDRYLLTNRDVCVGFPRGFDLLRRGGTCAATDAYLRQSTMTVEDPVAVVVGMRNTGRWAAESKR